MAHNMNDFPAGTTEYEFSNCMRQADDFFKIQLLRQAKHWYQKALATNLETESVNEKIAECDKLLAYEGKVVKILLVVAAVLVAAYFVFR